MLICTLCRELAGAGVEFEQRLHRDGVGHKFVVNANMNLCCTAGALDCSVLGGHELLPPGVLRLLFCVSVVPRIN